MAGGGMTEPRGVTLAGIDLHDGAGFVAMVLAEVGGGGAVRPGRGGSRVKTGLDPKLKKPAEGGRKKTPPARKAPTRGRYVDEYARPAG
jgi:hypothetical protein